MNSRLWIIVALVVRAASAAAEWKLGETAPDGDLLIVTAQLTGKVLAEPGEFNLTLPAALAGGTWLFNTRRWEKSLPGTVDVIAEEFNGGIYKLTLASKTIESQMIDSLVRFTLARTPARQPPVGRVILLAPRPGPATFLESDALLIRWASTGTVSRVRIVAPSGASFIRVTVNKELAVSMAQFSEDGSYSLSIEQADDNLVYGEPIHRLLRVTSRPVSGDRLCPDCRGRGTVQQVERCQTCSGTGQIAAGKGILQACPYCQGKGERAVTVICVRCNGAGRINDSHSQRTIDMLK